MANLNWPAKDHADKFVFVDEKDSIFILSLGVANSWLQKPRIWVLECYAVSKHENDDVEGLNEAAEAHEILEGVSVGRFGAPAPTEAGCEEALPTFIVLAWPVRNQHRISRVGLATT